MRPQHLDALGLANEVRLARARLRREVAALPADQGRAVVAAMFEDPEWCERGPAASATVASVLQWPVFAGPVKARRLLRAVGVTSELRTVQDLTGRQRRSLAARLRERPERAAA